MGNKAGGRALKNGIMFYSENYQVTTTKLKNGDIKIETREFVKSKFDLSKITGIPFIRPYIFFFSMLKESWRETLKLTLSVMAVLILFLMVMGSSGNTEIVEHGHSGLYTNLILLLGIGIVFRFSKVAKYHGAEHMAISALDNDLEISNESIAQESRISRYCGTNLVVFMFLIKFPLEFLGVSPTLSLLISISVGFELFLLQKGWIYKLLTPVYLLGFTIQKYLLTATPNEEQLEVARIGISKLKELEGY